MTVNRSSVSAAILVHMFLFLAGMHGFVVVRFIGISALIDHSRLDDHPIHHSSGVRHA